MLEKLEKIQWGISGFIVLFFVSMFVWPGLPKPLPDVLKPIPVLKPKDKDFNVGLSKDQRDKLQHQHKLSTSRIKRTVRSSAPPRMERRNVPREICDVAKDLRQAAGQVQLATWERTKRKTAVIRSFKEGSYLPDLGFEKGDEIELIAGMPLEFLRPDGIDQSEAKQLYYDLKDRFFAGEPLTITVNRGGERIMLDFVPP